LSTPAPATGPKTEAELVSAETVDVGVKILKPGEKDEVLLLEEPQGIGQNKKIFAQAEKEVVRSEAQLSPPLVDHLAFSERVMEERHRSEEEDEILFNFVETPGVAEQTEGGEDEPETVKDADSVHQDLDDLNDLRKEVGQDWADVERVRGEDELDEISLNDLNENNLHAYDVEEDEEENIVDDPSDLVDLSEVSEPERVVQRDLDGDEDSDEIPEYSLVDLVDALNQQEMNHPEGREAHSLDFDKVVEEPSVDSLKTTDDRIRRKIQKLNRLRKERKRKRKKLPSEMVGGDYNDGDESRDSSKEEKEERSNERGSEERDESSDSSVLSPEHDEDERPQKPQNRLGGEKSRAISSPSTTATIASATSTTTVAKAKLAVVAKNPSSKPGAPQTPAVPMTIPEIAKIRDPSTVPAASSNFVHRQFAKRGQIEVDVAEADLEVSDAEVELGGDCIAAAGDGDCQTACATRGADVCGGHGRCKVTPNTEAEKGEADEGAGGCCFGLRCRANDVAAGGCRPGHCPQAGGAFDVECDQAMSVCRGGGRCVTFNRLGHCCFASVCLNGTQDDGVSLASKSSILSVNSDVELSHEGESVDGPSLVQPTNRMVSASRLSKQTDTLSMANVVNEEDTFSDEFNVDHGQIDPLVEEEANVAQEVDIDETMNSTSLSSSSETAHLSLLPPPAVNPETEAADASFVEPLMTLPVDWSGPGTRAVAVADASQCNRMLCPSLPAVCSPRAGKCNVK
jgi:hypothetical protein